MAMMLVVPSFWKIRWESSLLCVGLFLSSVWLHGRICFWLLEQKRSFGLIKMLLAMLVNAFGLFSAVHEFTNAENMNNFEIFRAPGKQFNFPLTVVYHTSGDFNIGGPDLANGVFIAEPALIRPCGVVGIVSFAPRLPPFERQA